MSLSSTWWLAQEHKATLRSLFALGSVSCVKHVILRGMSLSIRTLEHMTVTQTVAIQIHQFRTQVPFVLQKHKFYNTAFILKVSIELSGTPVAEQSEFHSFVTISIWRAAVEAFRSHFCGVLSGII